MTTDKIKESQLNRNSCLVFMYKENRHECMIISIDMSLFQVNASGMRFKVKWIPLDK